MRFFLPPHACAMQSIQPPLRALTLRPPAHGTHPASCPAACGWPPWPLVWRLCAPAPRPGPEAAKEDSQGRAAQVRCEHQTQAVCSAAVAPSCSSSCLLFPAVAIMPLHPYATPASHLASAPQSARHILGKRRSIRLRLRPPLAQARLAARQQLPPLLCCRLESGGALIDSRLPEGRLDASILGLVLCQQRR